MIKTVFFDLDGTLLPLDQDEFIKHYFYHLGEFLNTKNYPKDDMLKAVFISTEAMLNNDGKLTNEEVFARSFTNLTKLEYRSIENDFYNFYENIFDKVQVVSKINPLAKEIVQILKDKGYPLIMATNPLFPEIATLKRIAWAGLNPDDFKLITTFENSRYCKPNLQYYEEIIKKFNLNSTEVLMIGNNVDEDMIVEELGMDTFLLTDCLINVSNSDISKYKSGNFEELLKFVKDLPQKKDK